MNFEKVELRKKLNETFEIRLLSSPGAGFVWKIKEVPAGLELVDTKSVPTDNTIGGSASEIFIIKGIEKGNYVMLLSLGRSWENHPINQKEYHISID